MTLSSRVLDLVVRGDLVVNDRLLRDAAVGVRGGQIIGIFQPNALPPAEQVIDARGQYVFPGAIDAHVHCHSAPEEGFRNATCSAAAGGVTTIIEMPYDAGDPVVTAERFIAKRTAIEGECVVDVALLATIRKCGGLAEIPRLAEEGACGFKVSLFETDPNRFPRIPDPELLEAFALIRETRLTVGVHAENEELIRAYSLRYRDYGYNPRSHYLSRPRVAESSAVLKALEFAHDTGVHLHIYHVSFPRIFQLVEWYRQQGTKVTAETCTHYLTLAETDMDRLGALVKINPPLRSEEERDGLWLECATERVDMVTSDHAPWTMDHKNHANVFENASGAPGVEALVPMMYSEGVAKGRISLFDFARLISTKPAEAFGLARKGNIAIGYDADFTIIDPNTQWTMDEKEMHSIAGWSPYHGWKIQGRVTKTIVRGKVVFDGQVIATPGMGQFVPGRSQRTIETQ